MRYSCKLLYANPCKGKCVDVKSSRKKGKWNEKHCFELSLPKSAFPRKEYGHAQELFELQLRAPTRTECMVPRWVHNANSEWSKHIPHSPSQLKSFLQWHFALTSPACQLESGFSLDHNGKCVLWSCLVLVWDCHFQTVPLEGKYPTETSWEQTWSDCLQAGADVCCE